MGHKYLSCLMVKILLLILFIFMYFMVIQDTEADTIIVDGKGNGDFTTIQEAVDSAHEGDTIVVWKGRYYENVTISKSLTIQGNGSAVTKIDSQGTGNVMVISADSVNVSGFGLKGGGDPGVAGLLIRSDFNRIRDNHIIGNPFGICIIGSGYNYLLNNTCQSNEETGILLDRSYHNILINNTCTENDDGIYIHFSHHNTLENNTCDLNEIGLNMYKSNFNIIFYNNFSDNNYYGLSIVSSNNNDITRTITGGNEKGGISMGSTCVNNLHWNDRDQDGVADELDLFPGDVAASKDTDGDGYPDEWTPGLGTENSTTGLELDAFPDDPSASRDSDGDGYPDRWNPGKSEDNCVTGLKRDEFPRDPDEWEDSDGDGHGDNSDDFPNNPFLYSYVIFFGTILAIGLVSGGYISGKKYVIRHQCSSVLIEIMKLKKEAEELGIVLELKDLEKNRQYLKNGELQEALIGLKRVRKFALVRLELFRESEDMIEKIRDLMDWARERELPFEVTGFEDAIEEHKNSIFARSIEKNRPIMTRLEMLRTRYENIRTMLNVVNSELNEGMKSVNVHKINQSYSHAIDAFENKDIETAEIHLQRCLRDIEKLKKKAVPELTMRVKRTLTTGEWNWVEVLLLNTGFAHARNIRIVIKEETVALVKHEKIHELRSGQEMIMELAVKMLIPWRPPMTFGITCIGSTTGEPYYNRVMAKLDFSESIPEDGLQMIDEDLEGVTHTDEYTIDTLKSRIGIEERSDNRDNHEMIGKDGMDP